MGDDAGGGVDEPRETAGITSRLVLTHVERSGGRAAVDAVLERAGLHGRERQLRDEASWFSYDTKIRLFESAASVLDDPQVMLHLGQSALDLNVAEATKLALRALGSPRLVYQNIVRANAKFSRSHRMELLELGGTHARISYVDLLGGRFSALDCQYNVGLLSCVPALFGLPLARITHPVCAGRGDDCCVYDVSWDEGGADVRLALGSGAVAAAAVALAGALAPALLPVAGAVAAASLAPAAIRIGRHRRARWHSLEAQLAEQRRVAHQLADSLNDLISELRLDDLLDKVTRNARKAVPGKEFVVLIEEDAALSCHSSSDVGDATIAVLEDWAADRARWEALIVDDTRTIPQLAALAASRPAPVGTIATAPLVYRGAPLGLLVGLAEHPRSFLPGDLDAMRSYAIHASIAVSNARLYRRAQELAARDPLTGLLNHREFHEALEGSLLAARRSVSAAAVALLDLDGFKAVNDSYGHVVGDKVLATVGAALAAASRGSDLCYRIGGDEFAVILPGADGVAAMHVCERLRRAIDACDGRVSASFGIASFPADGEDKNELLTAADARLYAAKPPVADGRLGVAAAPRRRTGAPQDERAR